jgi:glycine cleavage system aminomethyltransferase T
MPELSKAINGVAYNPEGNEMGFRVDDYAVMIAGRQMTIFSTENEVEAQKVMDWINDKHKKATNK